MPSGKIKIGHRDHIVDRKFHKQFLLDNPEVNITWEDFIEIIRTSNEEMVNIASTEQNGFKLPEGHGYLVVVSYKSSNKSIDIANSHKYGKIIYHNNLHTLGKRVCIRWFNNNSFYYYPKIYKFASCRTFARQVAKKAKEGMVFLNWSNRDFLKFDRIIKLQNSKTRVKWE